MDVLDRTRAALTESGVMIEKANQHFADIEGKKTAENAATEANADAKKLEDA
jgi:hypothetical protein